MAEESIPEWAYASNPSAALALLQTKAAARAATEKRKVVMGEFRKNMHRMILLGSFLHAKQ
jgi:hypothetical protein